MELKWIKKYRGIHIIPFLLCSIIQLEHELEMRANNQ